MSRMLEAELLKLRTTRTFIALTAAALGLSVLFVVLQGLIDDQFDEESLREMFNSDFTGLFILLLGAIGMAGEWRHKTITGTVLAAPQRLKLLAAKAISYAVAGILMSLIVNVVIMALGTLILSSRDFETLPFSDLMDILWRSLLIAGFYGAIGVFVGTLIRNPAGAIVVLLADLFIVENVLAGLVPDVWKFTPMGGTGAAIAGVDFGQDVELLSTGVGVLLAIAWLAVFYAAAAATFKTRDLT
jgi:ABC-type transport system involved in multi-copper enzyme maturation permease subunit